MASIIIILERLILDFLLLVVGGCRTGRLKRIATTRRDLFIWSQVLSGGLLVQRRSYMVETRSQRPLIVHQIFGVKFETEWRNDGP